MSGLGSGPRDGPVALMDGTSPLAHRTDSRAPPHADVQRPESPIGSRRRRPAHLPPVNGPPPLQGVVASGTPPPRWTPLFRTLRERRTARRASVHLQGIAAQSGGFCSQEHRREGEHDSRHGSLRAEGPRDSISAKPSHAPVPVPTMRVLPARQRRRDDRRSCFRPSARRARDGAHAMPPPHPRAPAFATCRSRNVRRVLFRYP